MLVKSFLPNLAIIGHRNENINSYINSYMDTLEKAKLTAWIHHIPRFFKSGILILNSDVPDKAGRKREEEE